MEYAKKFCCVWILILISCFFYINWSFSPLLFFLKSYYLFIIWLHRVLVAACRIFSCGMWILSCCMLDLVPEQGLNFGSLHWKHRVLATGPPEKSLLYFFDVTVVNCQVISNSFATPWTVACQAPLSMRFHCVNRC